jgi:hydroxymethylbilane synthase
MTLRICTRKSALALWQAERIKSLLGEPAELLPVSTEGDRVLDRSLAEMGGKGLFVKELEQALLDGRADLAVHSAKDVPFALPPGLTLCAFPPREDARDALVAPAAKTFANLPRGARVGTSSLRRSVQLLAQRPDLVIIPLRGNVPTRLKRAGDGLDAVVVALAGVRRLGLEQRVTEVLPPELSLPAAGQGAMAIETLSGSRGEAAALPLDDAHTARCVRAERAVLARLAGGCTVPVAAYAVEEGTGANLWLRAVLGGPDGRGGVSLVRAEARGADPEPLGRAVAQALLDQGGAPLLEAALAQASGLRAPKRA